MNEPKIPQSAFKNLETKIAAYNALDQTVVEALRPVFHLTPPGRYAELLRLDNLQPEFSYYAELSDTIETDDELSVEERYVLQQELDERWHFRLLVEAGEGLND